MTHSDHDSLRIGIIGLGKMGLLHAASFNSLPGCRVVAAADSTALPREILSQINPSIKTFADTESLLADGQIQAAVITTPVAYHVPAAIACVEHRIPFFMEKPLALTADQARPLRDALEKQPVPHLIGFMTRYVDTFAKAKAILQSGCLGTLQRAVGTIYVSQLFGRGEGWRYDRKIAGGGVLMNQGSHLLDLLTWFFGPVAHVNASAYSVYSEHVEDFAHVMIRHTSGLRTWLDASWSVRGKRTVQTSIQALGDRGSLQVNDDTLELELDRESGPYRSGRTVWRAADLYQGVTFDVGGTQYSREAEAFVAAIRSNSPTGCTVPEAYHVQAIIDAAYRSSQKDGAPEDIAS